ncbi:MAG: DHH family phosphoesterase, partial [Nanoarchaeota archaeon]|nr:DHH family phosphoesterase [Nanoarchaeota archaeon]
NVINMMRFMLNAKNPYEVLEESSKNRTMHDRYNQVESKYRHIFQKATPSGKENGKILFFQYGGDLSISSDLSNELAYLFPEKLIVVLYLNGLKANISMRGKKARDTFLEAIKDIEGARGGGHEMAVGGQISVEDIAKFRENLEKGI